MDDVDDVEATAKSRFLTSEPEPGDDDGPRATAATARLIVIALALVLVGVLLGRLTAPDGDDEVASSGSGGETPTANSPTPTFPAGDQSREPWWGLVGYERISADTFDRPDKRDGLGQTGSGETWETPSGQWGIEKNVARLYASDPERPSIAVVPATEGDGLFEITIAAPEQGAGLVFRYVDPSNYWAVTANMSLGTWGVTRNVDGQEEAVAELNAPVKAGTTITVVITGAQIRFLIDSVDAATIDDSTFQGVRTAGLIASAGSSLDARWDRFLTMEQPGAGDETED